MRRTALYVAAWLAFAAEPYRQPPQAILDVLHAPARPLAVPGPARDYLLLATPELYPPVAELAQPMLRLAGLRINPRNNAAHRAPAYSRLTLVRIRDGADIAVGLPAGGRVSLPVWSPDGRQLAFLNTGPDEVELWVAEAATGAARRLPRVRVNSVLPGAFTWLPDSRRLLVRTVPAGRGAPPESAAAPQGPNAQESYGRGVPKPTFQDLLRNPADEKLFEYYATSQLAIVDAGSGLVAPLGAAALITLNSPAPDARHVLVKRVHGPYSYLYPLAFFPADVEVWDLSGKRVATLASQPLADTVPNDGVRTGARDHGWRPDHPATVVWTEALDSGNPRAKVAHRDRIMTLAAPFTGTPGELVKTEHRLREVDWIEGGEALVTEYQRERRWVRTRLLDGRTVWSRSFRDAYNDPGEPLTRVLPGGHRAVARHGDFIYLAGRGASLEGDRPFLDRLHLGTLKSERLFRSGAQAYEQVLALLAGDASRFLTSRESPSQPPNYHVEGAERRVLTHFTDPTPQLRRIKNERVVYRRPDGVQLSFTLYLPPNHQPGTRLPTVVWAYPLEYNDPDTAGQITGSTQRFTTLSGASHLFFLLAGYAVLDNATMPVVGDFETVNNTYVEQIVASAKAAIDKAVELGIADPARVAVGGHSYGAFMTANLLAHSDLFRAGIARSGAYNRTLTPFGFQSERRTLWEAPETYVKMSPFFFAHRIQEPLLLIHGEADNNSGTFPIQSERMYEAVRANGGSVRLVILPQESHGYQGRESVEHALYEMLAWLDKHLKGPADREVKE